MHPPRHATLCIHRVRSLLQAFGLALGASIVGGCLLAHAPHAAAATYKWVDDKGVVHYTDRMPPEAVDRANVQLNKDGIPLRKVEPALTPEQRRAREAEEQRRIEAAKAQEEVARRDRALLASYTSESEIDLARARAVNTIDAVLQSSSAYTDQLTRRKTELAAKIATYANRQVPPVLDREMESLNEELARQAEIVAMKRKEMAAITAKYDAEKARYRELVAAKAAEAARATTIRPMVGSK